MATGVGQMNAIDDIQDKKNAASETISQDSVQIANGLITTDKAKLDVAAQFLLIHEQQYGDYTPEQATRLRWKIDMRLVPMLFVTQTIYCAIDNILVSNAALSGMKTHTHLTGQEYSWAQFWSSTLYFSVLVLDADISLCGWLDLLLFGYLIAKFPCNAQIQKFPVGKLAGGHLDPELGTTTRKSG